MAGARTLDDRRERFWTAAALLPAVSRPTVVFDTNVLVAELAFPEEPAVCVALAESGAVEAAVSPALLREFAAVLRYDHLPLAAHGRERRSRAVERVTALARVVEPAMEVSVAPDADDDAVLECALAAAADWVVSEDYHLRELDGFAGTEVLRRDGFLDRVLDSNPADPNSADRNPEG
jgi:putative PIN family toxin of toxin-antitoxin system